MLNYLFLFLFCDVFGYGVSSNVYYITPSYNESCVVEPCVTISQFVANHHLSSTTTLIFLSGNHKLDVNLWFIDVTEVKLQTEFKSNETELHCVDYAYLDFQSIEYIFLKGLKLIGCFAQIYHVHHVLIEESIFIGKENSGTAVELSDSAATIVSSSFHLNRASDVHRTYFSKWFLVAGVMLVTSSNLTVINSTFDENTAETGGVIYAEQNSNITLSNSAFTGNQIMCQLKCQGGVLHLNGGTLKVSYGTFLNNSAKGFLSEGGVFQLLDSTVSFSYNTFLHNAVEGIGGIISAKRTYILSTSNIFDQNSATKEGGVFYTIETNLHSRDDDFSQNVAGVGGVMRILSGSVILDENYFENNTASSNGGVIFALETNLSVITCHFNGNSAENLGGVIHLLDNSYLTMINNEIIFNIAESGGVLSLSDVPDVTIIGSRFINNEVKLNGGVSVISGHYQTRMSISKCEFAKNLAQQRGGVIYAPTGNLNANIQGSIFLYNSADKGGVLYARRCSTRFTTIMFSSNNASLGAVVYTVEKTHMLMENVTLSANTAKMGVMYLIETTGIMLGFSEFSNNFGSLFAINSIIIMSNSSKFVKCSKGIPLRFSGTPTFQEGGAITSFQSQLYFYGTSSLEQNWSEDGGAIHASESKLDIFGEVMIVSNTASTSGGGIYLYQSELRCHGRSILQLINNSAVENGGGINAISSSINVDFLWERTSTSKYLYTYGGSKVYFIQNTSKRGGGVCLSINTKLYILKKTQYYENMSTFIFTKNVANYGGAIYVADETNSGTCGSTSYETHSTTTECFLQALSLHSQQTHIAIDTNFTNNLAKHSGSDLFGGLLDRCTIGPFAEIYSDLYFSDYSKRFNTSVSGIEYLKYTSNINLTFISSYPVRLCFCVNDSHHNCKYKPPEKHVRKGELFPVNVVAVDQANHAINNTIIHTFLSSKQGGLGENQLTQTTKDDCTELKFQIFSRNSFEELIMYAEGPCKDAPLSQKKFKVQFSSCDCPVGFQPLLSEESRCVCECDVILSSYIIDCNPESKMVTRKGNAWITYINMTGNNEHGYTYLIYPHCPLDYCVPPSKYTKINLNLPNGSDAQCANHRSGLLCGVCQPDFSLSLGSSRCIFCPEYWPVLFVVIVAMAFLLGIVLVTVLLALNLTVAVGTLNGIIFYANILAANSSTFSISQQAFSFVIVSWLNMEFGIDACFVKGMSAFTKTWIQLIFPVYVILLVIIVILISRFSMRFSALIGKKNPVATLATLILLSYAKLLNVVITILSCGTLDYPVLYGHQQKLVWLPDATVDYFKSRHASLFITAVVILTIGVVYTALLFSWQWLHHLGNWKGFNWLLRNQKLSLFIEAYHAPYNPVSRYWTGFLLFVRVVLYVSAAANLSGDPKVNILIIGIAMVSIVLLKLATCQVYRKQTVDFIDSLCYVNLIVLCLATYFKLDDEQAKASITTISVSFTVLLVLVVLSYHVYYMECTSGCKLPQLVKLREQPTLSHESTTCTTISTSVIDKPEQESGPTLTSDCQSFHTLREPLLNESFI